MADYAELDDGEIAALLRAFGLSGSVERLAGGAANTSWLVGRETTPYVLTALDNHDRSSADRLVATTQYVRSNGVPAPEFIPQLNGGFVGEAHGTPVVVKRYVRGTVASSCGATEVAAIAVLLRRLHGLAPVEGLPIRRRRMPADWPELLAGEDPNFASWINEEMRRVQPTVDALRGDVIVHGDLFPDNIVVAAGGPVILDWETACIDAPLLDVGMTVVGLCCVNGELQLPLRDALLTAYLSHQEMLEHWTTIRDCAIYCAVVIGFHRLWRHRIRYPNAARWNDHHEMIGVVSRLRELW